jgi:hypothetical protein
MKESTDKLSPSNDGLSLGETVLRFLFIVLLTVALPVYMVVRVSSNLFKSIKSKNV